MAENRQRGAVRSVFWLLALTGLAVGLGLFLGRNKATVTLFWAPYRFDVSFNLVLLSSIIGFMFLYGALRGIGKLRAMPERARRWRELQAERSAVGALLDALSHLLAGRFVRAQSAGNDAVAQLEGLKAKQWGHRRQALLLSHLLVAESAQSLRNEEERDAHLDAALDPVLTKATPEAQEGVLLRAVRWAIEDRDLPLARSRLDRLPQGASRRIQALRLKLKIARLAGEPNEALEVARLLAKHKAFSSEAAQSVLRGLLLDAIKACHDTQQLRTIWKGLGAGERQMPEVALAAVRRAGELRSTSAPDNVALGRDVREWLKPLWTGYGELSSAQQLRFVRALEEGLEDMDVEVLGQIEATLRLFPNNAYWQYLAGQAFMKRQLWGKASQLLTQASHQLPEGDLLRRTWCSLALLAEERGDEAEASKAWKKAAQMG